MRTGYQVSVALVSDKTLVSRQLSVLIANTDFYSTPELGSERFYPDSLAQNPTQTKKTSMLKLYYRRQNTGSQG